MVQKPTSTTTHLSTSHTMSRPKKGRNSNSGISLVLRDGGTIIMRDRGRFQNFNFLATLHQKNTAIVIIICTTAHVQSLSSFGCNLVEIFEAAERWVVVDVWVGVSNH